ncbi:class 1 fructose-bisphosphatase [Paraferrimonas sp. SM1919]|uniref:class 1 fructose-bisphosphatase n=1 Tax=Paraferrimonas sp. SM1919 TaxID=2662263 RepID=UPI0013D3D167|nr:class 1 fructose-bisphosphatase [Paraferrimonas sp. SM1919]
MTLLSDILKKQANQELAAVIQSLAEVSKTISQSLQHGPLIGIMGNASSENVQGETQKQLDIVSNEQIKAALANCQYVKGIASEEEDDVVASNSNGQYLVSFDPLDGSSNIDINSLVGTIFSVLPASDGELTKESFLQSGRNQVAAGYMLYGPSTLMALTTGEGVQLLLLDPSINDYVLINEAMSIPADTSEFAINMSNQRFWQPAMQAYIADLVAGTTGKRDRNFNMRWIAAMVGDVHRVLSRGGIFMYPTDTKNPAKPYKLRLMYEANPMAWLVEQAGGIASTGYENILDIQPNDIHQRVAVILGSKNEVQTCLKYHN